MSDVYVCEDDDGWWWFECGCGYESGPFPGRREAIDEMADHMGHDI